MTDDVLDALDDTATTPRASIPSPSTSALGGTREGAPATTRDISLARLDARPTDAYSGRVPCPRRFVLV